MSYPFRPGEGNRCAAGATLARIKPGCSPRIDTGKGELIDRVPNMVIMQYINVFFSGFILSKCSSRPRSQEAGGVTQNEERSKLIRPVKLPFPLTLGFKSLLSRDIVMPDLDARWVS